MLRIVIPQNNIKERFYLLDVLFTQFLKISYKTIISKLIENGANREVVNIYNKNPESYL